MAKCAHLQCRKDVKCRGLCGTHYAQLHRRAQASMDESDARIVARVATSKRMLRDNGVLITWWDEGRERRAMRKAIVMGLI